MFTIEESALLKRMIIAVYLVLCMAGCTAGVMLFRLRPYLRR